MFLWPVVPLCERQLRDVNPDDILNGGLYRRCNIYKGGGGYDKFEAIYKKRFGYEGALNEQFVVQLKGCPLKCPYCYVTQDGIHGEPVWIDAETIVEDFEVTGYPVFHLMGGAPALYLDYWTEILAELPEGAVFHSDFLLQEGLYRRSVCKEVAEYKNQLHAVSIKGGDAQEFETNTGVAANIDMLWHNMNVLAECEVPFYLTYTGMTAESIAHFNEGVIKRFGKQILEDSFSIDIVQYEALKD